MGVARPGNIDNYAHLGGLLGGVMIAYLFGPKLRISGWDYNGNPMVVDTPRLSIPFKGMMKQRGRTHHHRRGRNLRGGGGDKKIRNGLWSITGIALLPLS